MLLSRRLTAKNFQPQKHTTGALKLLISFLKIIDYNPRAVKQNLIISIRGTRMKKRSNAIIGELREMERNYVLEVRFREHILDCGLFKGELLYRNYHSSYLKVDLHNHSVNEENFF